MDAIAQFKAIRLSSTNEVCSVSRVFPAIPQVQQIHGADDAFVAVLRDGAVVTWGDPRCGGDSSRVQEQLRCL